jgi:prophage regulatory protein
MNDGPNSKEAQMSKTQKRIHDRFIRESEVKIITGLSRSTRWRLERQGKFPIKRRLSANIVAWLESEIHVWMQSRIMADVAIKEKHNSITSDAFVLDRRI